MVKGCNECQLTRVVPPVAPLNPLPWPSKTWSCIHMDYAGPFINHVFLVIIDAGSKWIESFLMHLSTSKATIQYLKTLFAQFGIPNIIATDNGSCFVSSKFEDFLTTNGIHWNHPLIIHPVMDWPKKLFRLLNMASCKKMKDGTLNDKLL